MIIPDDAIEFAGKIFAGEYDIQKYENKNAKILDIGANIGSFARWASYRWPGCSIQCYEPIASNFNYLIENTKDLSNVECHNVAIGSKESQVFMYYGIQNCGQCSFYKTEEQVSSGETVNVISATTLDYADIVKIDTEGAEVEIVKYLQFQPHLFLIEYHSLDNRSEILNILNDHYTLMEYSMMNKRSGMLKLAKNSLFI